MRNKYHLFFILIMVLFSIQIRFDLQAQTISGVVKNTSGDTLPFTTILVKENTHITTSNEVGAYLIKITPGTYNIEFRYLGYQTAIRTIEVKEGDNKLDVVLPQVVTELKDVTVNADKEDPAYTVIRKAIAKAKFHINLIDSSSHEVYIKGKGRVKEIPWYYKKQAKKEGLDTKVPYISESVSLIQYRRPNITHEKVISIFTQGDTGDVSPNIFLNGSMYEPKMGDIISPLSPVAFAYYRFYYEGIFEDQGVYVNKIRVVPKSKGDNVFKGHIYIIEDLWSIHSTDLQTQFLGFIFDVRSQFIPVKKNVWLPSNYYIKIDGKALGFGFEYEYNAVLDKYYVEVNPDLDPTLTVLDPKIDKIADLESKQTQKVKDIKDVKFKKKELTNKELNKLMKKYEKEQEQESKEKVVLDFEYDYKVAKNAKEKDSLYWLEKRPVPLTKNEIMGYKVADSLNAAYLKDSLGQNTNKFKWSGILVGGTYKVGPKHTFKIDPNIIHAGYSTVDGFYGQLGAKYIVYKDTISRRPENRKWMVEPKVRYAFNRKAWSPHLSFTKFIGKSPFINYIKFDIGQEVLDINDTKPLFPIINSYYTLFYERNITKFYERNHVKLSSKFFLRKNLFLDGQVEIGNRTSLKNIDDLKFFDFDREFTSNDPFNIFINPPIVENQRFTKAKAGINWKPFQKYIKINKQLREQRNTSPLFRLAYERTIIEDNEVLNKLEFYTKYEKQIGARGTLGLVGKAGLFLDQKPSYFFDFNHFRGDETILTVRGHAEGFSILPYYTLSTNDRWAQLHTYYRFRKFLFSRLQVVQMTGLRESVFVNHLELPSNQRYTELGFAFDGIARLFRLDIVTSYNNKRQLWDFGFRFGISTLLVGNAK